jgi:NAD(P)-dependent dehydrogenase (short-subunit alcohol dehydrogenase family)
MWGRDWDPDGGPKIFLIMHRASPNPLSTGAGARVSRRVDTRHSRKYRLADSVALVTGGGRGIGRDIALAFAEEGARVAVASRTLGELERVASECRERGVPAIALSLDVTDPSACARAVERCISEWGRVGVVVNNAGTAESAKFTEIGEDLWSRTLAVDLTGPFLMTRAALPAMLARSSGAVISISSIAGKVGAPYIAPYCAAKHGVIGLMRSLAAEYARSGVTFNCVRPAYVDTPLTDRTIDSIMTRTGRSREEAIAALYTPQQRLIRPEEVAAVCILLAGPDGRSINGQAINVDGGTVQS